MASSDLVAQWQVPLSDGVYLVEFEHGTTTGKRVIRINGKVCETLKKNRPINIFFYLLFLSSLGLF